jgi:hypothetical protein
MSRVRWSNDNKHKRGPKNAGVRKLKIKTLALGGHGTSIGQIGQASTSNVLPRAESAKTQRASFDAPTETYAITLSYNFGVLDLAVALRLQQQAEIPDGR